MAIGFTLRAQGKKNAEPKATEKKQETKSIPPKSKIVTLKQAGEKLTYSLGLNIDAGGGFLAADQESELSKQGYILDLGGFFSLQHTDLVFDIGAGWAMTSFSVPDENEIVTLVSTRSTGDETLDEALKAKTIDTSYGFAEIAASRKFDKLMVGVLANMTFGTDTSFSGSELEEEDLTPHVYLGAKMLLQNEFGDRGIFSRFGLRFLTDISIAERQIYFLTVHAALGLPLARPETVVKERVEYRTKIKVKKEVQIVQKERDRYILIAGIINFVTGKYDIDPSVRAYLSALGTYLQQNADKWESISIISHTDKRGSYELNRRLSTNRAGAVSGIFASQGVPQQKIQVDLRTFESPVAGAEDAISLAKNRRVEVTIVGREAMLNLETEVLRLQQLYKMPSTCEGLRCY